MFVSCSGSVALSWPTRSVFEELGSMTRQALPSILSVLVENVHLEFLVLLAAILHGHEMLAAQIVLIAVSQFLTIIPYTLAITTGSMVRHSMRTLQRPVLAIAFSQMIAVSTTALCLVCNMLVYLNK